MGNQTRRWRAIQRGAATYRLVRYADDFVVMVFGTRQHAENLYSEVETILGAVGLRLAPDMTQVTGIDEGFDFLGFRIQRHTQRGSNRQLISTYPSKKVACEHPRQGQDSNRTTDHQPARSSTVPTTGTDDPRLGALLPARLLQPSVRAPQPPPVVADLALAGQEAPQPERELDHPPLLRPRPVVARRRGNRLFQPATVKIERYRFRRAKIPDPWQIHTQNTVTTAPVESPVR